MKKTGDGDAIEEFAHTQTIARGGCSFISAEVLGVGSTLELLIAIDGEIINAPARVIYEHPLADGRGEGGAEFLGALSAEDADRIAHLLEKTVATE